MLIGIIMEKILTIFTIVTMFGVVLYGSGSVIALDTASIQTAGATGFIQIGMENNASFLAPMPMNVYINPICIENSGYEQGVIDNCYTSPRFIC